MQKTEIRPTKADADDVDAPVLPQTDAIITYAADSVRTHRIGGLVWSYDGTPESSGTLSVEDGSGNIVLEFYVTAGGPGFIPLNPPMEGTVNTALIVTLSSGGAGVWGKITVLGHVAA